MTAPSPLLVALTLVLSACAGRSYTAYLIEPAPRVHPSFEEREGTQLRPFGFGSTTSMKVSWNDGNTITEVQIPMLSSGQRIFIEHTPGSSQVQRIATSRLVPPPPSPADAILDEAYRERGLRVDDDAAQVSLSGARSRMQQALDDGNHALALEWCALVLERYPSHPETLRAKGSILLLLGERDKAIETYEMAEAIEPDAAVRETLQHLLSDTL